jgi:uncharacterized protein YjbI with pentapeptide repeats
LSPNDLLKEYARGRRDFSRCNLLREELKLELPLSAERYPTPFDHPDLERYNALWVDFRCGIPGEKCFNWDDIDGRYLPSRGDIPTNRDLKHADLRNIDLSGSYLYPLDLANANLSSADLRRCVFIDCILSNANLDRADLRDAYFLNSSISAATLSMARMDRATLVDCDARRANLKRAKFYRAGFNRVDFRGATLHHVSAERCTIMDSDIRGVDMSTTRLPLARIKGLRMTERQVGELLAALDVIIEADA